MTGLGFDGDLGASSFFEGELPVLDIVSIFSGAFNTAAFEDTGFAISGPESAGG